MVNRGTGDRRGASRLGCLLSLALFVGALYYGVHIGEVYLRYYQLLDAMRWQARLAATVPDAVIAERLEARADSLFSGPSPRFRITRGGRPHRITIEARYTERVELPLFSHTFVLSPKAEEPL